LNKALVVDLEISEKSRLFISGVEKKKSENNKFTTISPADILKQEIQAKEKELKALIEKDEKEAKEKKAKEEAEKKKQMEEKAELEKVDKEKKEKENQQAQLRKNISGLITKNINDGIEKLKSELISQTINQTLVQVESLLKGTKLTSLKEEEKEVHNCVRCDGCGMSPIRGIRYKCTECHNFDFCEACEELNVTTHTHVFLKIRSSNFKTLNCERRMRHCRKERKNETAMTNITKTSEDKITIDCGEVDKKVVDVDDKDFIYKLQVEEIRAEFALDGVSDDVIIEALKKFNGDLDQTLACFFN